MDIQEYRTWNQLIVDIFLIITEMIIKRLFDQSSKLHVIHFLVID